MPVEIKMSPIHPQDPIKSVKVQSTKASPRANRKVWSNVPIVNFMKILQSNTKNFGRLSVFTFDVHQSKAYQKKGTGVTQTYSSAHPLTSMMATQPRGDYLRRNAAWHETQACVVLLKANKAGLESPVAEEF